MLILQQETDINMISWTPVPAVLPLLCCWWLWRWIWPLTPALSCCAGPAPCVHLPPAQRTPDKRAPAVVSLAFTGLALAPLALLVLYLGALGVNFAVSGTAGLRHIGAVDAEFCTLLGKLTVQDVLSALPRGSMVGLPDKCTCDARVMRL